MVSPAREYSLKQHLLERPKFSGIQKENLTIWSTSSPALKISNALAARYLMDILPLNNLMNLLLDTPRLASVLVVPTASPKPRIFELNVTLGE
jgi:hypothetical protein